MEKTEKQNPIQKAKSAVINAIDENGNGKIDLEDVIYKGLKTPGIKINRAEFLAKTLQKHYPQEIIDTAIEFSPMKANIPVEQIDKLANDVIKFERNCVSGISAALSAPGGLAAVATIPADIVQYYGYLLRAMQKLMYLYGFPQINTEECGSAFDDGTMNVLIVCFGVMHGVAGASNALKTMAKALGAGVQKQLMRKALTKGTIYPVTKKILKWFNVKLTKKVFTDFFNKAIPVVGGVIGGGITYLSFKPCCDKLKNSLRDTALSNPDYKCVLNEEVAAEEISEEEAAAEIPPDGETERETVETKRSRE